jgi:PadR family transcriptional regulator PadR
LKEINSAKKKFMKEIKSGTAALVLLGVLAQAVEPMYGYQISKILETGQDEPATIKQGALYPVLRSLESGGLLESTVEPSISGPPRRYYQITQVGRESLEEWSVIWQKTKEFVDTALGGEHNG